MKTNPNTATLLQLIHALLAPLLVCWMATVGHAAQPRIVFHEIVNPGAGKTVVNYEAYPAMSGNGQAVVYSVNRGDGQLDMFAINTDGTGARSLGVLPFGRYNPAISHNGALAAMVVNSNLFTLNTASGSPQLVLRMVDANISSIAINDDGSKMYFTLSTTGTIFNTSTVLEAGVWEMNPDGSGRRLVAGLNAIRGVLGLTATGFERVGTQDGLAISQNNRLVFTFDPNFFTGLYHIMGVNADGTVLHSVASSVNSPHSTGISRDGSRVAFDQYSPRDVHTANWLDGTSHIVQVVPGHGYDPLRLTENGSHLALVDRLLRSDGGTVRGLRSGTSGSILAQDNEGSFLQLSGDGRKICAVRNFGTTSSLMILDLDPSNLRGAPDIANTALTPYYAVQNSGSASTVTAQVTYFGTPNGLANGAYVWTRLFQNGLPDQNDHYGDGGLFDDGTNGDAVAGNGLFTQNQFRYDYTAAPVGPRVARFVAENVVGGLRHATMVDHEPFFVVASAPAGSAPVITSVTPDPGTAGGTITINGSNFGITRTGNVVTLAGYSCYVLSANGAGTQLTVEVPNFFANGPYPVIVAANGRSSAPFAWQLGQPPSNPDIELAPTTLAFGNVTTGTTSDQSIQVSNTGTADLVISAIASNNGRFVHVAPALPLTIPAGQFSHVFVRFSPLNPTAEAGTLTITSNDPDEGSVPVSLTGTGTGVAVPILTTLPASGFSNTSPTLNASVNANNGTSTTVSFQYGLTTAYGSSVASAPSSVTGSSDTAVSAAISGLAPNTVYHFRVVGVAGGVTYYGGNLTFATGSITGATRYINFENFTPGVKSADFLAAYGIPSVTFSGPGPGVGGPRVIDHTFVNSTIPSSPNLLEQYSFTNDANQTHILTFTFAPELAAFSFDRVGKHSNGSTDTWHADFYNAAGTFLGSFGEASPLVNAPIKTFTFTAPVGQTIARMDLVSVWTGFATHRNIPIDNFLLEPTLSPGGVWRRTCFDTSSKAGNAADEADPDHDGIVNFLEFSTLGDPNASGTMPGELVDTGGGVRRFVYFRSKAAVADGIIFTVQWSDDLAPGSWSSAGVTEEVLFENAEYQEVWATYPQGTGGRFVRLKVSR